MWGRVKVSDLGALYAGGLLLTSVLPVALRLGFGLGLGFGSGSGSLSPLLPFAKFPLVRLEAQGRTAHLVRVRVRVRIRIRVRVGVGVRVSKREEAFVDQNRNLNFENRTM